MRDQWKIKRVMGYTGYYRVLSSAGGGVKGSVWYEPSFRRYKWMASSRMGIQTGWSRTPTGAKRLFTRNVADEALAGCSGGVGMREFYSLSIACRGIGVVAETVTRLCQMAIPIAGRGQGR